MLKLSKEEQDGLDLIKDKNRQQVSNVTQTEMKRIELRLKLSFRIRSLINKETHNYTLLTQNDVAEVLENLFTTMK